MRRRDVLKAISAAVGLGAAGHAVSSAAAQAARPNWHPLHSLDPHLYIVNVAVFSSDGTRLLTGGEDSSIKMWDVTSGRELWSVADLPGPVKSTALSPDATRLIASGLANFKTKPHGISAFGDFYGGFTTILSIDTGQEIHGLVKGEEGSGPARVAFNGDGSTVTALDGAYRLKRWDTASGKETLSIDGRSLAPMERPSLWHVAFDTRARRIASINMEGREGHLTMALRTWDIAKGSIRALDVAQGGLWSVALSRDGSRVALGRGDHTLEVWDFDAGRIIRTFKPKADDGPLFLEFDPSGSRLVSAEEGGVLRVWDADAGLMQLELQGPKRRVRAVAFSAERLLVASGGYKRLKERDPETRTLKLEPLEIWEAKLD